MCKQKLGIINAIKRMWYDLSLNFSRERKNADQTPFVS
jgi:hypothetical protein